MFDATCTAEGCDRQRLAKQLCAKHYQRLMRNGSLEPKKPQRRRPPRPLSVCAVPGCDRLRRTRDWCPTHYKRWRETGDASGPIEPRIFHKGDEVCSVECCDRQATVRDICSAHYVRLKTGLPMNVPILPCHFIGDAIDYHGMHERLRKTQGPARQFDCVDCGSEAADWSYDHADPDEKRCERGQGIGLLYSTDPSHYVPRCKPCHKRFDWAYVKAAG